MLDGSIQTHAFFYFHHILWCAIFALYLFVIGDACFWDSVCDKIDNRWSGDKYIDWPKKETGNIYIDKRLVYLMFLTKAKEMKPKFYIHILDIKLEWYL